MCGSADRGRSDRGNKRQWKDYWGGTSGRTGKTGLLKLYEKGGISAKEKTTFQRREGAAAIFRRSCKGGLEVGRRRTKTTCGGGSRGRAKINE